MVDERKDKRPMDGALLIGDDIDETDDDARAEGEYVGGDDGKAEDAAEVLQGILDRMGLEATVAVRSDEERIVLDVGGRDAGRAIGKKGQTLDALQFLVNKIVNRFPDGRRHVVVDSGDYRDRHDKGLEALARREAKRAIKQGKVITLEPMSARDRRVIHLSLAKFEGVSTRSNGEGMHRRIQIIPARGGREDVQHRRRS